MLRAHVKFRAWENGNPVQKDGIVMDKVRVATSHNRDVSQDAYMIREYSGKLHVVNPENVTEVTQS